MGLSPFTPTVDPFLQIALQRRQIPKKTDPFEEFDAYVQSAKKTGSVTLEIFSHEDTPFFSPDDPIREEIPKEYIPTEKVIERGLKHCGFTKISMHGSQLLHGSSSPSLLAFTRYSQGKKGLLPAGYLEKSGKVSFCGANDSGRFGVNITRLSTVTIGAIRFCDVLRYTKCRKWTPEISQTSNQQHLKTLQEEFQQHAQNVVEENTSFTQYDVKIQEKVLRALKEDKIQEAFDVFSAHLSSFSTVDICIISCIEMEFRRLAAWEKLDENEKLLVTNPFPVLYGIKSMRQYVHSKVSSYVSCEVGLLDGASPDEIRVIFVPSSRLDFARRLMAENGNSLTVEPFPKVAMKLYPEFDTKIFE